MKYLRYIALAIPLLVVYASLGYTQTGIWSGTSAAVSTANANGFMGKGQNNGILVQTTEANVQSIMPTKVVASNLFCTWTTPAQAGGLTFTLRDGAANTAITFSATSGTTGNDTTHTAVLNPGDLVDIQLNNINTSNSSGTWRCAFQMQ